VLRDLKLRSRGSYMLHSAVNITSVANACEFKFLWLGQSGVPPLQVCLFSGGFKMVTPHLTACTICSRNASPSVWTSGNVPVILIYKAPCVSVSRCRMHCEHTLWFHDTIQFYVWCWHPYSFHWQEMNGVTSVLAFHSWKFSGLLTMWVCSTIGMSVTHCLPVDNTQCQPTTAVISTHIASQTAQIYL